MCSLPVDFFIKTTGKAHIRNEISDLLPLLPSSPALNVRYLSAVCLTTHYAALWEQVFDLAFTDQRWSQPDNPRLP